MILYCKKYEKKEDYEYEYYYANSIELAKEDNDKLIMIDVDVSKEKFNDCGDRNLCYLNKVFECGKEEYKLYKHYSINPGNLIIEILESNMLDKENKKNIQIKKQNIDKYIKYLLSLFKVAKRLNNNNKDKEIKELFKKIKEELNEEIKRNNIFFQDRESIIKAINNFDYFVSVVGAYKSIKYDLKEVHEKDLTTKKIIELIKKHDSLINVYENRRTK